ncbi:MAG: 4-(cytidine 5'-diphospho)-2-C-methyl-D-erythritol kinase [Treponema sp.]|nr:4-(cytidine 5'-diphospho)-2-C-methyl-D-erythritol kinase [Treponema sp.]
MVTEVCEFAPAKINFNLCVLPEVKNGFHNIESIFQTVTLTDQLNVSLTEQYGSCRVFCEDTLLPENNTITSSYAAFCSVVGKDIPGVNVKLIKGIPSGGGLGGGSSDAAAFIRALEKVSGIELSVSQKKEIASRVGSDVFFFLFCGREGCAVVTGRGEIVKPIHARNDLYILLVFPGVQSPTKSAYALVDRYFASGKTVVCPAYADLETIYNSPVSSWNFANSFTPSLVNCIPEVGRALDSIRAAGALYGEMSGSGSTVYGVFPSAEEAENAGCVLAERWKSCVVVRPSRDR